MKGLIRGLIIGLALVLILVGITFYFSQQREKAIEEMSKKFTAEELLKMAGEQAKSNLGSDCPQVVNEYKNESQCQSLLKTDYRDACYYCFAYEKQDSSICEKITDGNILQSCKEQISQSVPVEEETANWKMYQSPDGFLRAQIIPVGKTQESKVKIRTDDGVLLQETDYLSEDGEHGLRFVLAKWTPNSQFFIYSTESSGGHQPWFSPVYFYNRSDSKIYSFAEVSGFTIADDEFTVTAPDIITFRVYTSVGMGPSAEKSFNLSDIISKKDEIVKKKARDLDREADMRQLVVVQKMYYDENGAYFTSAAWPSKIGFFMSETPTDPGNGTYIWLNNIGNSQKYCTYAVLEEGGWSVASQQGSFKCSDGVPTIDDCCS